MLNNNESIIGKEISEELITEIRKAGLVLRLIQRDGRHFYFDRNNYRHERINIFLTKNIITNFWRG